MVRPGVEPGLSAYILDWKWSYQWQMHTEATGPCCALWILQYARLTLSLYQCRVLELYGSNYYFIHS
jgi:hypothetical protein